MTRPVKRPLPKRLHDAEQVLIWKAALGLCDRRTMWPRALERAISMIEARDPNLAKQIAEVRERAGR